MSAKLKVTILVGGRWHAFDLARGLKARGVLHRLVTSYPWFKVKRWGFSRDEVVTLPATQWVDQVVQRGVPARWRTKFQHFIHSHFAEAAARYVEGADIVHGWSSFSEPAIARCRALGIPFVLERSSSHMLTQCQLLKEEQSILGLHGGATHPEIVEMEIREYAAANRVAVPSRFVERSFIESGFPIERIAYNPLGVNLAQFSPGTEQASGEFRVIYAGSLTYRKGIHYLVEGYRQAAIAGARLVLVGGPSDETGQLIGEPPPGLERVGHVPQSELVRHYRRASVFVLASIEEGMAMVQAQALACGLPLICTENTGGEDLLQIIAPSVEPVHEEGGVRRYPAGFVVPIRDPASIARCLLRLHHDPQLLLSQSQAALRIHQASLDWQAYSDRAITQYRQIIQTTPQHV